MGAGHRPAGPRTRAAARRNVALLLDTQGPAIRTGVLQKDSRSRSATFWRSRCEAQSAEPNSITVNYDDLINDVSVGDVVLLDNGLMQVRVLEKGDNRIRTTVLTAGTLGSRRHINLPGVHVNLPALTEKDLADVALGVELGVDFVALSFARKKEDLEELRQVLQKSGSSAQVVAKIESQSAVREIDDMIEAADVILIARGDLGIECPMEELPIIQRRIVKRCLRFGKPVIVATQMLESMVNHPVPTRAEITDVANAVFEQADAIMLTGETTAGRYPVECVKSSIASRCGSSGAAALVMARKRSSKTRARRPSPRPSTWPTHSRARRSSSSPTMGRWRAMSPTCARSMRRFSPSPRTNTFVVSSRFAGECSRSGSILRKIRMRRSRPRKNICASAKLIVPNDNLVVISDVRAGQDLIDTVQLRKVG